MAITRDAMMDDVIHGIGLLGLILRVDQVQEVLDCRLGGTALGCEQG